MTKVHHHAGASHKPLGNGAKKADDPKGGASGQAEGKHEPKAAEKLPGWRSDFKAADRNHDGKLSKSELKLDKSAKAFDHDHDGKISKAEYHAGYREAHSFAGLDADHDGSLSKAEMKRADRFTEKSFDTDGDGKVSEAEFVAGRREENVALKAARRDARFDSLTAKQKKALGRYDTDGDGKLSRAEFNAGRDKDWADARTAKIAANFARAGGKDGQLDVTKAKDYGAYDADADGRISEAEFLKGQMADRREYWKEGLVGKQDKLLARRLDLDALGLGINAVKKGSAAPGPGQPPSAPASPTGATDVTISSFNLLGSSHTTASGNKPEFASGPARMKGAVELLKKHKVDIVGFQEMEGNQLDTFKKLAGDQYGIYPGRKAGKLGIANSLAWDKSKWDLVKANTVKIPYFDGHERPMPVVRLRNKETGQEAYFTNFHNPADTARFHHQEKYRDEATHREVALVNKLRKQTGLPVFVTGDMNEGNEYFNHMTKGAPTMHASSSPNGKPPKRPGIDWVFGSSEVKFTRHVRDHGALVRKTTDHPMIIANATIRDDDKD